jgi:hypothetical protein
MVLYSKKIAAFGICVVKAYSEDTYVGIKDVIFPLCVLPFFPFSLLLFFIPAISVAANCRKAAMHCSHHASKRRTKAAAASAKAACQGRVFIGQFCNADVAAAGMGLLGSH